MNSHRPSYLSHGTVGLTVGYRVLRCPPVSGIRWTVRYGALRLDSGFAWTVDLHGQSHLSHGTVGCDAQWIPMDILVCSMGQ